MSKSSKNNIRYMSTNTGVKMKKLLIGLLALGSLSGFAETQLKKHLSCKIKFYKGGEVVDTVQFEDALERNDFLNTYDLDKILESNDKRFYFHIRPSYNPNSKSEALHISFKDHQKSLSYSSNTMRPTDGVEFRAMDGDQAGNIHYTEGYEGRCLVISKL